MTDENAEERFARCLEQVLAQEGGYADHPSDPGGATNFGITRKTLARWRGISPWWNLPKARVKSLSAAEAGQIYHALYWLRARGPDLPAGLDLALFDYGVNSGPERAIRALQSILKVRTDGWIGPVTLAALGQRSARELAAALCDSRLGFLGRLSSFSIFGRGWTRRVATIRATALQMAGAPTLTVEQRNDPMDILNGYKTYIVAAIMLAVGIAGLFGIEIPTFDGHEPMSLVMEALAFIFLRKGLKTDLANS